MTTVRERTQCVAWRNNYGSHWRGDDADSWRCSNLAQPGAQFCAHHTRLSECIQTIEWKDNQR